MRIRTERGATLIFVAVALFSLVAFSAIVVDYGVLWAARGGAQNSADFGALAGARSLADGQDPTHARDAATVVAQQIKMLEAGPTAANVTVTVPLNCPAPFNVPLSPACIKVDVQRQNLPTFFSKMVGINTQGVKATATAMAGQGNSVECIKPWVVADKWIDASASGLDTTGWDQMDKFNPGVDTYTAPGFKAKGTPNDYGTQLVLKEGNTGDYSSGWTMQIEFGQPGSKAYEEALGGCPSWVPTVGLYDGSIPCASKSDSPNPEKGCLDVKPGMAQGPTTKGVGDIIAKDSSATYNTTTKLIEGGCMGANTCDVSPRVVPIAIFNTAAYVAMDAGNACNGGNCRAQVINILGFFVEGMCDEVYPNAATRPAYCGTNAEAKKSVVGRLINYPGQASGVSGAPGPATFLTAVVLVR